MPFGSPVKAPKVRSGKSAGAPASDSTTTSSRPTSRLHRRARTSIRVFCQNSGWGPVRVSPERSIASSQSGHEVVDPVCTHCCHDDGSMSASGRIVMTTVVRSAPRASITAAAASSSARANVSLEITTRFAVESSISRTSRGHASGPSRGPAIRRPPRGASAPAAVRRAPRRRSRRTRAPPTTRGAGAAGA
ncbi:hypothetical protein [Amnibacterium kyonggiense]